MLTRTGLREVRGETYQFDHFGEKVDILAFDPTDLCTDQYGSVCIRRRSIWIHMGSTDIHTDPYGSIPIRKASVRIHMDTSVSDGHLYGSIQIHVAPTDICMDLYGSSLDPYDPTDTRIHLLGSVPFCFVPNM